MLIFLVKYWKQIATAVLIVFLLILVNIQHAEIKSLKNSHAIYVKDQQALQDKAQIEAQNKLINAEKEYNAKLLKISADADLASNRANSLSKQLAQANARLKTAKREAVEEYSRTQSDVLSKCITEYRNMAKIADEYRANAERNE
jgi:regulator of protease activity HflC (stomatin/prohibitin superfamily)